MKVGLQINHIEVLLRMINKETLLVGKQPKTKKERQDNSVPVLSTRECSGNVTVGKAGLHHAALLQVTVR